MSDGLYNMVSKEEMSNTIVGLPITTVLDNGVNDNVSVILVNGGLTACSPVKAQFGLPQNPVR